MRERTFYPKPGLLQFSDGERIWLIDPIALANQAQFKTLLAELLANPNQTKILHSVGEDFEVLHLLCGQYPQPLFDTQIAAALLGWPLQLRYETLAAELLGIEFPGGLARNNWCKRPLPDTWLEYAAHDVIALPAMCAELEQRLAETNRLDWLREDCQRSVERAAQSTRSVLRIRSAARLKDQDLAKLLRLADWRDTQARKRDLPRSFVASDAVLLSLVREQPGNEEEIATIDGVHRSFAQKYADQLLALLNETVTDFQRPPELLPLSPQQQSMIKAMQACVQACAQQLKVEAPLIASKRELTRLVQTGQVDWLDGWRGDLIGDQLNAILDQA